MSEEAAEIGSGDIEVNERSVVDEGRYDFLLPSVTSGDVSGYRTNIRPATSWQNRTQNRTQYRRGSSGGFSQVVSERPTVVRSEQKVLDHAQRRVEAFSLIDAACKELVRLAETEGNHVALFQAGEDFMQGLDELLSTAEDKRFWAMTINAFKVSLRGHKYEQTSRKQAAAITSAVHFLRNDYAAKSELMDCLLELRKGGWEPFGNVLPLEPGSDD